MRPIPEQDAAPVSKCFNPVLFLNQHNAMKTYWGSGGIAPLIP
jgi:hypothetical protein